MQTQPRQYRRDVALSHPVSIVYTTGLLWLWMVHLIIISVYFETGTSGSAGTAQFSIGSTNPSSRWKIKTTYYSCDNPSRWWKKSRFQFEFFTLLLSSGPTRIASNTSPAWPVLSSPTTIRTAWVNCWPNKTTLLVSGESKVKKHLLAWYGLIRPRIFLGFCGFTLTETGLGNGMGSFDLYSNADGNEREDATQVSLFCHSSMQ